MKIKIKELAKKKGWSLYRLALNMGMNSTTIYSWASSRTQPSYNNIDLLCTVLDCNISDLFEAEEVFIGDAPQYCHACKKKKD